VKDVSARAHQGVAYESSGKFPEMEEHLVANIRFMRELGLPLESWVLEYKGNVIFHQLYPNKFLKPDDDVNDDNTYPFQFSSG